MVCQDFRHTTQHDAIEGKIMLSIAKPLLYSFNKKLTSQKNTFNIVSIRLIAGF